MLSFKELVDNAVMEAVINEAKVGSGTSNIDIGNLDDLGITFELKRQYEKEFGIGISTDAKNDGTLMGQKPKLRKFLKKVMKMSDKEIQQVHGKAIFE